MTGTGYYLHRLSDPELLLYWQLFHDFPTQCRAQRARLAVLRGEVRTENTPKLMNLSERQTVGRVTPRPPKSKEVAA
jgi:hypothetical protein